VKKQIPSIHPQTLDNFCESMMNHGIQVREAQYKTFLEFHARGDKNVGFASSFNLRHAWYHPQNKLPAGERIARWALATQYGFERSIHWKPPMVTKMEVVDGTIHLHFDQDVETEERGAVIEGFAISGADKAYQPAKAEHLVTGKDDRARIRYDRKVLVLKSPHVPKPVHYRYAWARNPMGNVRAAGNPKRDIALATQRSDDWAWWDVPGFDKAPEPQDAKATLLKIRDSLKQADRKRRIADAKLVLESAEEG
jgi:sialate O-acetylesterase